MTNNFNYKKKKFVILSTLIAPLFTNLAKYNFSSFFCLINQKLNPFSIFANVLSQKKNFYFSIESFSLSPYSSSLRSICVSVSSFLSFFIRLALSTFDTSTFHPHRLPHLLHYVSCSPYSVFCFFRFEIKKIKIKILSALHEMKQKIQFAKLKNVRALARFVFSS